MTGTCLQRPLVQLRRANVGVQLRGGGWLAIELGQGLDALFWAMGIGLAVYGLVMGGMLLLRPWQARLPLKR